MTNAEIIISVITVWAFILVSPGPNFVVVSNLVLTRSHQTGIGATLGIVIGAVGYASLTLFGFSLLLEKLTEYHNWIRVAGGTYLIWLGIRSWRLQNDLQPVNFDGPPCKDFISGFKTGLLTSLTNPKAIAFFLGLFATLITPTTPVWVKIAILTIGGFLEFIWYNIVAFILSRDKPKALYFRAKNTIDRCLGVLLAVFGLKLILQER